MPVEGDAEKVITEILSTANKEAESLLERALKTKQRRLEVAKEESLKPYSQARARAKLQADREKQRILALAALEAKRKILNKQQEFVERVFSDTMGKIDGIRKSASYQGIITKLIEEAAAALGDKELIVEFDSSDSHIFTQEYKNDLCKRLSVPLQFRQNEIPGGGVVLRSAQAIFDNSFSARLLRLERELRKGVLDMLLGAKEQDAGAKIREK